MSNSAEVVPVEHSAYQLAQWRCVTPCADNLGLGVAFNVGGEVVRLLLSERDALRLRGALDHYLPQDSSQ